MPKSRSYMQEWRASARRQQWARRKETLRQATTGIWIPVCLGAGFGLLLSIFHWSYWLMPFLLLILASGAFWGPLWASAEQRLDALTYCYLYALVATYSAFGLGAGFVVILLPLRMIQAVAGSFDAQGVVYTLALVAFGSLLHGALNALYQLQRASKVSE